MTVPYLRKLAIEKEFFREHPGQAFDEGSFELRERQVTFQFEPWLDALPEIRPMFKAHYDETIEDDTPFDFDYEHYEAMAKRGVLFLLTARDCQGSQEDPLAQRPPIIGYVTALIKTHPHAKSTPHCFVDSFYIRPEYRVGMTGYNLLKFLRDTVSWQVNKIYISTKLKLDLDPLLRRLGFAAIERVYTMTVP